jgi:hypothetical protein
MATLERTATLTHDNTPSDIILDTTQNNISPTQGVDVTESFVK